MMGEKFIESQMLKDVAKVNRFICKAEMELYVPIYNMPGNWSISRASGERISRALCAHGIIVGQIEITVVPIEEKMKSIT